MAIIDADAHVIESRTDLGLHVGRGAPLHAGSLGLEEKWHPLLARRRPGHRQFQSRPQRPGRCSRPHRCLRPPGAYGRIEDRCPGTLSDPVPAAGDGARRGGACALSRLQPLARAYLAARQQPPALDCFAAAALHGQSHRGNQLRQSHGACGVFMRGHEGEWLLSDPALFPIYQEAERLDLPICVHAGTGSFNYYDQMARTSSRASSCHRWPRLII